MSDFALGLDLKASVALDFSVFGPIYFHADAYILAAVLFKI